MPTKNLYRFSRDFTQNSTELRVEETKKEPLPGPSSTDLRLLGGFFFSEDCNIDCD